ncbi:MAG TPA: ABC transporter permease [Candidatus Nitrosotalea sp.]|nr:ABC transporter permease [Candidatus Nitrosotalea sp.]
MSWRAEPLGAAPARGESWAVEWVRLTAFAYRNLIMARRNVFFVFELTFWPGVAMVSHGLLTRFLDLTPQMTAFILLGTIALSAVQVCQLDVAYAVLFDIWSKSMKHQFLTPVRIHHLALGSWLVGVARGVIVWALMALIGGRAFGFDFVGAGPLRVAMFLLGCFMTALVIGLLVCALVLLFGTRAETSAWAAVNFFVMLSGIYYPISVLPGWAAVISEGIPLTYFLDGIRAGYGFPPRYAHPFATGFALSLLYVSLAHWALAAAVTRSRRTGLLLKLSE